jgi:CubicO group peptidase (beta-lactamase class C family)
MYRTGSREARHVLLLLLILLLCLPALSQQLQTASPETVGLSAERLERISATIQRSLDENRLAGAVTLVARNGRVAWLAQLHPTGDLNLERTFVTLAYQAINDWTRG